MPNPNGTRPQFAQIIKTANCKTTAAKTTLEDDTNAVKLYTAGAYGAFVKTLRAQPITDPAANTRLLALRHHDGEGATVLWPARSKMLTDPTLSVNVAIDAVLFDLDDDGHVMRLGANEELWVGASVACSIIWDVEVEDFADA